MKKNSSFLSAYKKAAYENVQHGLPVVYRKEKRIVVLHLFFGYVSVGNIEFVQVPKIHTVSENDALRPETYDVIYPNTTHVFEIDTANKTKITARSTGVVACQFFSSNGTWKWLSPLISNFSDFTTQEYTFADKADLEKMRTRISVQPRTDCEVTMLSSRLAFVTRVTAETTHRDKKQAIKSRTIIKNRYIWLFEEIILRNNHTRYGWFTDTHKYDEDTKLPPNTAIVEIPQANTLNEHTGTNLRVFVLEEKEKDIA